MPVAVLAIQLICLLIQLIMYIHRDIDNVHCDEIY